MPKLSAQRGPEPEETIQRKKRKRKESPNAKKRARILDDLTMVIATRERRFTFEDVTATDDHRPIAAKEFDVKKPGNLVALMAYNDQEDDPDVYEDWDAWENDKYTYQTVQLLRQQLPAKCNVIDYLSQNNLKTNIKPLRDRHDIDRREYSSIRWHQEILETSKPWVEEVLGSEGTETTYREIDIEKPAEDLRSDDAMSYYSDLSEDEYQIGYLYNEIQPLSKLLPIQSRDRELPPLPDPIGGIWGRTPFNSNEHRLYFRLKRSYYWSQQLLNVIRQNEAMWYAFTLRLKASFPQLFTDEEGHYIDVKGDPECRRPKVSPQWILKAMEDLFITAQRDVDDGKAEEATLKKLRAALLANKELRRKLEEVRVAREIELHHISAERRFSIDVRGHRDSLREFNERLSLKNFDLREENDKLREIIRLKDPLFSEYPPYTNNDTVSDESNHRSYEPRRSQEPSTQNNEPPSPLDDESREDARVTELPAITSSVIQSVNTPIPPTPILSSVSQEPRVTEIPPITSSLNTSMNTPITPKPVLIQSSISPLRNTVMTGTSVSKFDVGNPETWDLTHGNKRPEDVRIHEESDVTIPNIELLRFHGL